jgi:hypothetical protein
LAIQVGLVLLSCYLFSHELFNTFLVCKYFCKVVILSVLEVVVTYFVFSSFGEKRSVQKSFEARILLPFVCFFIFLDSGKAIFLKREAF